MAIRAPDGANNRQKRQTRQRIYRPKMIVDVRCYIHLRGSCLKTLQIILFDIFIWNIYPALGMIRDGTSSKSWAEYLLQSSGGVYLSTWKSSSSQFKCSINWRFQISIHLLKHYRGRLAKSIALKAHSLELCIGSLYMNAFFIHLMNSDTYPHSTAHPSFHPY